jgi:hypothetical protein
MRSYSEAIFTVRREIDRRLKMSIKKWLVGAALIAVSAGAAFANGAVGDDDYGPGSRDGYRRDGNRRDGMEKRGYEDIETRTVEGAFTMVDGEYPAIVTDDGETLYLMIHARIEDIPQEGADLKLEAFPSPMSPVHIMVVSAEVNGVELELDDQYGPGGPGGDRGRGMQGGGMHGGGRNSGPRMSGGRGAQPGWGYEDSQDE